MKHPIALLLALVTLIGCGDDDESSTQHFSSSGTLLVAANYNVRLSPISSDCATFQAVRTDYRMAVGQFGANLNIAIIDENPRFSGSELFVSVPPFAGNLFSDGVFDVLTQGNYLDALNGYQGTLAWDLSGNFTTRGFAGFSDTQIFDPVLGLTCRISHSVVGDRV